MIVNKTYRTDISTQSHLNALLKLDIRCHNESSAISMAWKDASNKIAAGTWDWKETTKDKYKDKAEEIKKADCDTARSFSIDDSDWERVCGSFKKEYGLERVTINYLVKLIIIAARNSFGEGKVDDNSDHIADKAVINIEAAELMAAVANKTARLIKEGRVDLVLKYMEEE